MFINLLETDYGLGSKETLSHFLCLLRYNKQIDNYLIFKNYVQFDSNRVKKNTFKNLKVLAFCFKNKI